MFGEGLIGTLGDQHKKQRKMLNPVFSVSNMRDLLPVIQPIADQMAAIFTQQIPGDGGAFPSTTLVSYAESRHSSPHRDRRHAVAIARCPGIHFPSVFRVHV